MRRLCFLVAASFVAASGFAQATPTPTPSATPVYFTPQTLSECRQLIQAALSSDYAYRQVAHLTENIGARLTGSAQAAKAVEYVAAELKALGGDVELEKTAVPHWVRGEERAELVQYNGQVDGTTQKIVLTALGGSVATPADGITADVVSVRNLEELKALPDERVKGKIVLFNHAYDKAMAAEGHGGEAYGIAVTYRSEAPVAAATRGAVAALIRSVGGAEYRIPHTGATRYAEGVPKIPAAAVTAEDADLIANLSTQGATRMHLVLTPQTLPDVESANVIADFKGTEQPKQIVVVSGHLDSWDLGTGAIDDGAGVAVAMQAAQLLRQTKLRPKRTIRVIAWMNEENGSRGSEQYETDHAQEFANHFAVNETDGGAGHPIGLNVRGRPELRKLLVPLSLILDEIGAGTSNLAEHVGADTEPIEKSGVPAFSPMQDSRFYFNYHHTAADTLDKIVPRELQENAAVVAAAAYAFANSEQPLPR